MSDRPPAPPRALTRRPSLPSATLVRLPRSLNNSHPKLSTAKLSSLVNHLRLLYSPKAGAGPSTEPTADETAAAADSGYISEADESGISPNAPPALGKHDAFERSYAKEWLLMMVKRGEEWIAESEGEERQRREELIEEAAGLVASLAETSASGSISRPLTLPTCAPQQEPQTEPLIITLNDALPSSLDATSVGLQSWGSSIVLARLMALEPKKFGIVEPYPGQRALELGAGTGLLSLVWKGMSERVAQDAGLEHGCAEVVATDYHDAVLENLRVNVVANSPAITPAASPSASPLVKPVDAKLSALPAQFAAVSLSGQSGFATPTTAGPAVTAAKLDWSAIHSSRKFASSSRGSLSLPAPFDRPFRTLLAADVVYGPEHAAWLKSCVEQFLEKPDELPRLPKLRRSSSTRSRSNSVSGAFATPPLLSLSSITPLPLSLSPMPTPGGGPSPAGQPLKSPPATTPGSAPGSAPGSPSLNPTTAGGPVILPGGMTVEDLPEPAFHLIVPCRPTHAAALKSIGEAFPLKETLGERKEGEPWRVGVLEFQELERLKGVGRADEETYRLYKIGWC